MFYSIADFEIYWVITASASTTPIYFFPFCLNSRYVLYVPLLQHHLNHPSWWTGALYIFIDVAVLDVNWVFMYFFLYLRASSYGMNDMAKLSA